MEALSIKELKALPKEVVSIISQVVGELSMNPYPQGVKTSAAPSIPIELDKALIESYLPSLKQLR